MSDHAVHINKTVPLSAVAFADIGKSTKTLLNDVKSFPSDAKVAFTGITSSGLAFTSSVIQKEGKLLPAITALYTTPKYNLEATYDNTDKVLVTGTLKGGDPSLKLVGSVVLPNYQNSAKATIDYAFPYLHIKSTLALVSSPTLDIAAATRYGNFVLGVETGYDSGKAAVSKYTFAAGYHAVDHQVVATLSDNSDTLKVAYAHCISPLQTVGAEVVRKLSGGDTGFALGYQRKLLSGANTKFRLDNTGALSVGYETKLSGGEKVVTSVHVNTTDLNKAPKYGFALDLF